MFSIAEILTLKRTPADPKSPEALAKAGAEATKKSDWAAFARLMHPEALAELNLGSPARTSRTIPW